MADLYKLLDIWAEKLLDTGKRNNMINFRDAKASSAEIICQDINDFFARFSSGQVMEVYDPKIEQDYTPEDNIEEEKTEEQKQISREEFIQRYSRYIRKESQVLVYAQTPNPMTAIKNIAKRSKQVLDETGINVSHLAFGFIRWTESKDSNVFYNAPLLLMRINIIVGSVLEGIRIEISDDDVIVNPTFNYLLQADYGESLPVFEDDDTFDSYISKVTPLIRKMNWELVPSCKMGIFSFLKLNMYEDLKRNKETILGNGNIRALLGEKEQNSGNGTGEETTHLKNPLVDLHTVVDADSSQIEAIEMAKSGKSFVLQGPPGTGKSQTITNIIAECLYDGKKVLFVSEKQAALNVVYDKLKKAGLADFCLELHSHKANKKAVIEELNRTLELPRSEVKSTANVEILKKQEAQRRLDAYAAALHKKRGVIDKSAYQLFELYSAERKYPDYRIPIKDIEKKDQKYLDNAVELLEQYVKYIPSIGHNYRENIWYGFKKRTLSFDESCQLKDDLEALSKGFTDLKTIMISLETKYTIPELTQKHIPILSSFLQAIADHAGILTQECFLKEKREAIIKELKEIKKISDRAISARDKLLQCYSETLLSAIDGQSVLTQLKAEYSSSFKQLFNGKYRKLISSIQTQGYTGKLKYNQAIAHMEELATYQSSVKEFRDKTESLRQNHDIELKDLDTAWEHIIDNIREIGRYERYDFIPLSYMRDLSTQGLRENRDVFRREAENLNKLIGRIKPAKERVIRQFEDGMLDLDSMNLIESIQKMDKLLRSFEYLNNWNAFQNLLKKLEENELAPYIDIAISEQINPEDIVGSYKKAFYRQWIECQLYSIPELTYFSQVIQDQAVNTFAEKDRLQYEISKLQIKSELSQKRPDLSLVAGGSEVAILRREGLKKRKQMPIRKLLGELNGIVQILKPCFLMSPLSVSTFLASGKITFDTIVFDEASQIFPQDAVGTIYRGKQLIVVGDSKQMPPSNFFNSTAEIEEDEEETDITDFDSILDICSSVFDTERLAWHYRSHYETLIAFSNLHFYNNGLITFPSSAKDRKGIGVDYYFADGVFDRKSKTNRKEAELVVELVYKHIKEYPDRSLGVVAFSVAQQDMIDNLIMKRREEDPSNEWFFKDDRPEPFFVKNLETVQGDERDTIIFSVAYAKDNQGKFYHNFGPLNRNGGERRLNVAVTRAKENVQLVASIHYSDINLNNSGAEGVRLLRAYLDYAQNGEEALERAISVATEDHYDSDFEQEVCEFLRDRGFTVDTQVGCSGYRIDMGVRKPDSSDYYLAIECDGATYHKSKNARDRDRLRQEILERMGWKFYRIWSTDWYRNKPTAKMNLLHAVKEAAKEPIKSVEEIADTNDNQESIQKEFTTIVGIPKIVFEEYKELDAMEIMARNRYNLFPALKEILEQEAPLSEEWFLKRIVSCFGREKVTSAVTRIFESRIWHCEDYGIIRRNGFMYLKGMNDIKLRVPGDRREIRYISYEELADGFFQLIKQNVSVNREGLYRSMTNLLGFSRTGENIVSRYDSCIEMLEKSGAIYIENDTMSARKQ